MPETDDEKALFQEKQKYMYAVLEKIVCTDRGKAIIREHESDFDAQSVYRKLLSTTVRLPRLKSPRLTC